MKNKLYLRHVIKTFLCLIMSLVIVGICAACFKGSDETDSTATGKYDITNNDAERSFEGLGLPKLEITGDTIKYLNWMDKSKLDDPKEWFYQVNLLLQKYYNCKIEFITTTYEELPVKAAQMVLSGQSPDLIFYKSADDPGFINNNIVQPINDYIDMDNKWFSDMKDTLDSYAVNGKYYNVVYSPNYNDGYVYYWKSMFTDIGEKTPLELYKSGKWTWSKFKELAKKLTVDNNNDGTPEVYGCNVDAMYFYTACGEDFVKRQSDGTLVNNMKSASISKAMNFLHDIGKTGDNVNGGDFNNSTAAMLWNESWMSNTFCDKYKAGTVEFAPTPKMDNAEEYYVPGRINCDWLAKGASNPGGVAAYYVIQQVMNNDTYYKNKWDEISRELNYYTDDMYALMDEMNDSEKFIPVVSTMQGVGNWESTGMWNMLDEISKWGTPWTTCLETYYQTFQSEIDRANKK